MGRKTIQVFGLCSILAITGFINFSSSAFSQDVSQAVKKKVLSIPACSFQELNEDADFYRAGSRLKLNSGSMELFFAPLILPNNTRLKKLTMICHDNDSSKNIQVHLYRSSNTDYDDAICSVTSSGAATGWRTFESTNFTKNKIDNHNNLYVIRVLLEGPDIPGLCLHHIKIYYVGTW